MTNNPKPAKPNETSGATPEITFRNPTAAELDKTAAEITGFVADRDRSMFVRHLQAKVAKLERELTDARDALAHRWECQQILERTVKALREDVAQVSNTLMKAEKRAELLAKALKRYVEWHGPCFEAHPSEANEEDRRSEQWLIDLQVSAAINHYEAAIAVRSSARAGSQS